MQTTYIASNAAMLEVRECSQVINIACQLSKERSVDGLLSAVQVLDCTRMLAPLLQMPWPWSAYRQACMYAPAASAGEVTMILRAGGNLQAETKHYPGTTCSPYAERSGAWQRASAGGGSGAHRCGAERGAVWHCTAKDHGRSGAAALGNGATPNHCMLTGSCRESMRPNTPPGHSHHAQFS
jgi:hypothetical protein